MVYPHSNAIGKEKPKPAPAYYNFPIHKTSPKTSPTFADIFEQEMEDIKQQMLGSQWAPSAATFNKLLKDNYSKPLPKPEPIKKLQLDFPVYSQQAHELRLVLKVDGLGIGSQTIGARWMVSDQHIHHHKGLPVDQAEHLIDTMLADIKKNLMNQIKEKAK